VYRFDLVDRSAPVVVGAGRPGHLWFVDAANRLTSLDATTGQAYTISQLPRSAKIRWIEVGAAFVYAVDASAGRVYIVSLPSEKVASLGFTFIASAADVAVTPDDLLWFAVGDQLLRLDPRTGQVAAVDAGAGAIGALAGDSAGRVWFAVGNDKLGRYDPRSQSIVELSLPRKGSVTSMVVDATGTLIVGTAAGEIFAVQNDSLVSSGRAGKAILQLALDPAGTAWYLSDDGKQLQLSAARLRGASRTLPASVVGIWFDARSNAWLADQSSAGFFIAVPEAR
jgi:streptogramin lyase